VIQIVKLAPKIYVPLLGLVYFKAISWFLGGLRKKQPHVAISSTEAESSSQAATAAEIIWIHSLLNELKVPFDIPHILCDSLSNVKLAQSYFIC